jgi:hypothetical protein
MNAWLYDEILDIPGPFSSYYAKFQWRIIFSIKT